MTPSKIRKRRPIRSGKNSTWVEKTGERLHAVFIHIFGNTVAVIAIGAAILLTVSFVGIILAGRTYADPERVFWATIDNNLQTRGVTKEIKQQNGANAVHELTQLTFTPNIAVKDLKKVSTQSTLGKGRVMIESIGTPKDTYQHYILIDQPARVGKSKPDYGKVYPMWLRNGGNLQGENTQLFNNAIFGAMLFGDMQNKPRTQTIDYLKKAYSIDFDKISSSTENGRKVYTYKSKINLKEYAHAASFYAKSLGLPVVKQINPAKYKDTDKLEVNFKIDVRSRQVREITYRTTSTTEAYNGYGIKGDFSPPVKTVSYDTLQKTIKTIAQ